MDPDARARLDETMTQIAGQTGATLHVYQHQAAPPAVWSYATPVTIAAPSSRPGVSEFFEDAITSYDWVYVIAPDRVGTLFTLLGGHAGDDVPGLLATYHDQHGGQINDLLRGPRVAATFSNWHS